MKVVLVSPAWPPEVSANGIVTYVGALRAGLTQLGVDVRVAAARVMGSCDDPTILALRRFRAGPTLLERARRRFVSRTSGEALSRRYDARAFGKGLRHMAPSFTPDLIEMEESFGSAELVARHTGVPVVLRLHGPWFLNGAALGVLEDEKFQTRVTREGEGIARARALTSPSQDLLDRVRRRYGIALADARVIPNPAPAVDAAMQWSLPACDPDLLLFVGRFDLHKGGDLVVDAFAAVAASRPGLKLAFIGPDRGLVTDGGAKVNLQEYLRRKIPDSSVRSRISQLGQLPASEIAKWRQRARLTVVASRFEVFPMVVVEALAFGCPLVAPRAGGIPELVAHGENGFLFESGNSANLAHSLEALLDRPELSAKLGSRAAADSRLRFGADVICRRTKDFYDERITHDRRLA